MKGTPDLGGIRFWFMGASLHRIEGTFPIQANLSSTILARLRLFTVARQHRIDAPRELLVALQNHRAHFLIIAFVTEALKLIVKVKDESWPFEASRLSAGPRMQPDYKKSFFRETQRKMRIVRLHAYATIVGLTIESVLVGQ